MKERPILFSGPMVRAILEDRKTQTRRVCKDPLGPSMMDDCPYGEAGERLWVRETFFVDELPYATGARLPLVAENGIHKDDIYYRADGECCQQIPECQCSDVGKVKWRPGIHMPRWASRITLEITKIRVERVQKISEADSREEGAGISLPEYPQWDGDPDCYRKLFRERWNIINAKRRFGWDANPWVWVIEFRLFTAN